MYMYRIYPTLPRLENPMAPMLFIFGMFCVYILTYQTNVTYSLAFQRLQWLMRIDCVCSIVFLVVFL